MYRFYEMSSEEEQPKDEIPVKKAWDEAVEDEWDGCGCEDPYDEDEREWCD